MKTKMGFQKLQRLFESMAFAIANRGGAKRQSCFINIEWLQSIVCQILLYLSILYYMPGYTFVFLSSIITSCFFPFYFSMFFDYASSYFFHSTLRCSLLCPAIPCHRPYHASFYFVLNKTYMGAIFAMRKTKAECSTILVQFPIISFDIPPWCCFITRPTKRWWVTANAPL